MQFVPKIKPVLEEAGRIVLEKFHSGIDISVKSDGSIATEADLASEGYIKAELEKLLPGATFCAERRIRKI